MAGEMGADGAGFSCCGSSVVAESKLHRSLEFFLHRAATPARHPSRASFTVTPIACFSLARRRRTLLQKQVSKMPFHVGHNASFRDAPNRPIC